MDKGRGETRAFLIQHMALHAYDGYRICGDGIAMARSDYGGDKRHYFANRHFRNSGTAEPERNSCE